MNYRKVNIILAMTLALLLCIGLIGCAKPSSPDAKAAVGGILRLKVNPEFAIHYDDQGLVTAIEARNPEAKAILDTYTDYVGKDCNTVVTELVGLIGDNGYFVEEVDGVAKSITIEIEQGTVPNDTFLTDIATSVQTYVDGHTWNGAVELYDAYTDYGPDSDGVTDYDNTDYGPNADGVTDYDSTDYGPNADGVTDYDNTDYGPNGDGVTDYDDTDYGPNGDGVTDYDATDYVDTDYGPNADGVTDYDNTDYGPNGDGVTDYDKNTDYDKDSDYDKNSDYKDSDYNG